MSLRVPNTQVAVLTLALVLTTACHARRSADTGQPSPLTPVAQETQRRGYCVKESLVVPPTAWEASTLRMRGKRFFSFRADQPQPGTRDYFCRFSLFEETYDSVDDARQRLANLHIAAPSGPDWVDEYRLVMRTGFRIGTVTYFLETDATIFWDEVKGLAKELANSTPGAELTHGIINALPNKSLDRSAERNPITLASKQFEVEVGNLIGSYGWNYLTLAFC